MNENIISLIIVMGVIACIIALVTTEAIRSKKRDDKFDNMLVNNVDYQNLKIKQNNLLDNYLKVTELRENIEKKEKELKYFPKDYIDLELQKMKTDFQKMSTDYYNYIAIREQAIDLYHTIRDEVYYSNK